MDKKDINAQIIALTQPFYDLSEDIAHGRILELAPPFESYKTYSGDIISYCNRFFEEYNSYLGEIQDEVVERVGLMMSLLVKQASGREATFHLKDDVKALEEMIIHTLAQCFKGLPSEAVAVFEAGMLANNMHLFELIPQLSVGGVSYFRVRKDDGHELNSGKDLFHVPFDKRSYCGSYRYSIPGYPSLYLAKTLDIAKLETGIQMGDTYYAACFRPKRELHFIDLALTQSFETIWERYSLLVFYPLIMACGLKVRIPNAPFKPEYALPQVMAQVFRLHMKEGAFDGFSYISTKEDKPDFMDVNMRNFVLWIKGADQEKEYSKSLADEFTVSGPMKCRGDQPTGEIENALMNSWFSQVLE